MSESTPSPESVSPKHLVPKRLLIRDQIDQTLSALKDIMDQILTEGLCCEKVLLARNYCNEILDINYDTICDQLSIDSHSEEGFAISFSLHDMRSATKQIIQYLGLLDTDPSNSARWMERLAGRVDALNYSKRINHQMFHEDVPSPFHIKATFSRVVDRIKLMMRDCGIDFSVSIEYPEIRNEDTVEINLIRIFEIFRNLARNAADAGATQFRIRISNQDDRYYKIEIENNGFPIPSDIIDRLFHVGFTSGGNKKFGGNGIGLYGSKQCVERMGGSFGETEGSVPIEKDGLNGPRFTIYLRRPVS